MLTQVTIFFQVFLRMLVEYTKDDREKRRLQELCSTQGIQNLFTIVCIIRLKSYFADFIMKQYPSDNNTKKI